MMDWQHRKRIWSLLRIVSRASHLNNVHTRPQISSGHCDVEMAVQCRKRGDDYAKCIKLQMHPCRGLGSPIESQQRLARGL
jgi:hypothetical protein